MRLAVSFIPFRNPNLLNAVMLYSEHVGTKRQQEGSRGDIRARYSITSPMAMEDGMDLSVLTGPSLGDEALARLLASR